MFKNYIRSIFIIGLVAPSLSLAAPTSTCQLFRTSTLQLFDQMINLYEVTQPAIDRALIVGSEFGGSSYGHSFLVENPEACFYLAAKLVELSDTIPIYEIEWRGSLGPVSSLVSNENIKARYISESPGKINLEASFKKLD